MDDINRRISISASYNRATEIVAADIEYVKSQEGYKGGDRIIESIDFLARAIFFKEQAFYNEVVEREKEESAKALEARKAQMLKTQPQNLDLKNFKSQKEFLKEKGELDFKDNDT